MSGNDVFYFDVLDQQQLDDRALKIGYKNCHAPYIHYVSPTGDLSIVDRRFRAVISSHCVEHQPCLIRHLEQVAQVLDSSGRYFLLIPDKRYCFDHFIAESTIAGVLQARDEARRTHTLASVIEHRALTTHNDAERHWRGDHADFGFVERRAERTQVAVAEYSQAGGDYIDVHAWQFTSQSFRQLMHCLRTLGATGFEVERAYETPRGRNEFCVVLRKV